LSSDQWCPFNVPSPHGIRYCLLVIDHYAQYIWVRFLKSKDDACCELETNLLDIKHLHARHHSQSGAFAPVIKFDSDYVLEPAVTRHMCARLGVGVQLSAPYAHHMLGKAERPWRTIRDSAAATLHSMAVPNSMWSCVVNTDVYLRQMGTR
jgi:transposase InsO family protein